MVERQGKLRLDRTVTGVAKARFGFFKQIVVQPAYLLRQSRNGVELPLRGKELYLRRVNDGCNQVHRVALVAGDSGVLVLGVGKKVLRLAAQVAGQAALGVFLGTAVKAKNELICGCDLGIIAVGCLVRVGVSLARSVAGLASHRHAFRADVRVRGLAKLQEFRPVAGTASVVPYILVRRGRLADLGGH